MQLNKPYIRSPKINPSRLYAASAYRPTALFDPTNPNSPYLEVSRQIIVRATNPFAASDSAVIDSVKEKYNLAGSPDSYKLGGQIGGAIGLAGGLAYGIYKAAPAIKLLYSSATGAKAMGPWGWVGWGITAAATALYIGGHALYGYQAGKAAGQTIASQEGWLATKHYYINLGNSLYNRPITTVGNLAISVGIRYALGGAAKYTKGVTKTILQNPYISGLLRSTARTGIEEIQWFKKIDDYWRGPQSEIDQMTFVSFYSMTAGMHDTLYGGAAIKGIMLAPKEDNVIKRIGQAYGIGDEGFRPIYVSEIREAYGIDFEKMMGRNFGVFGNAIFDTLGEISINVPGAVKKIENKLSKTAGIQAGNIATTKMYESKSLRDLFFKKVKTEDGKEVYMGNRFYNAIVKSDFLHGVIQRIFKEWTNPELGKNPQEVEKIKTKNKLIIRQKIASINTQLIKMGYKDKEREAIFNEIEQIVTDAVEETATGIAPAQQAVSNAIEGVDGLPNEGSNNPLEGINFDTVIANHYRDTKNDTSNRVSRGMLLNIPALRSYALAVDHSTSIVDWLSNPARKFWQTGIPKKLMLKFAASLSRTEKEITPEEAEELALKKEEHIKYSKLVKEMEEAKEKEMKSLEHEFYKSILGANYKQIVDEINEISRKIAGRKLEDIPAENADEINEVTKLLEDYKKAKEKHDEIIESNLDKFDETDKDVIDFRRRMMELQTEKENIERVIKEFGKNFGEVYYEKRDGTKEKVKNKQEIKKSIEELQKKISRGVSDDPLGDDLELTNQLEAYARLKFLDKTRDKVNSILSKFELINSSKHLKEPALLHLNQLVTVALNNFNLISKKELKFTNQDLQRKTELLNKKANNTITSKELHELRKMQSIEEAIEELTKLELQYKGEDQAGEVIRDKQQLKSLIRSKRELVLNDRTAYIKDKFTEDVTKLLTEFYQGLGDTGLSQEALDKIVNNKVENLVNKILREDEVKIDYDYSSELFSALNIESDMFKFKNEELYAYFNAVLKTPQTKEVLDRAVKLLGPRIKDRAKLRKSEIKILGSVSSRIRAVLEDLNTGDNPLLDETQFEYLSNPTVLLHLTRSIIFNHYLINSETSKEFKRLNPSELNSYLMDLLISDSDGIDPLINDKNMILQNIIDVEKEIEDFRKEIEEDESLQDPSVEHLLFFANSLAISMKGSKYLNALNRKYNKIGFFEREIEKADLEDRFKSTFYSPEEIERLQEYRKYKADSTEIKEKEEKTGSAFSDILKNVFGFENEEKNPLIKFLKNQLPDFEKDFIENLNKGLKQSLRDDAFNPEVNKGLELYISNFIETLLSEETDNEAKKLLLEILDVEEDVEGTFKEEIKLKLLKVFMAQRQKIESIKKAEKMAAEHIKFLEGSVTEEEKKKYKGKIIESAYYNMLIKDHIINSITSPSNYPDIIRGPIKPPFNKIDLNKYNEGAKKFMEENLPTIENIMILLGNSNNFVNSHGNGTILLDIGQFTFASLPEAWQELRNNKTFLVKKEGTEEYEKIDVRELDKTKAENFPLYSFITRIKLGLNPSQKFLDSTLAKVDTPIAVREYFKEKRLDETKSNFTYIDDKEYEYEGAEKSFYNTDMAHQIVRALNQKDENGEYVYGNIMANISNFRISTIQDVEFSAKNGNTYNNKFRILRFDFKSGKDKQTVELAVPVIQKKNIGSVKKDVVELNGVELILENIYDEDDHVDDKYIPIIEQLARDLITGYSFWANSTKEDKEEFTLYRSQEQLFFSLYDKRPVYRVDPKEDGTTVEKVVDYIYKDPNTTDMEFLKFAYSERLPLSDQIKFANNDEIISAIDFSNEIANKKIRINGNDYAKYTIDATPTNPKSLMRTFEVFDENGNIIKMVSLGEMYQPLGMLTPNYSRVALGAMANTIALKQSKIGGRYYVIESPLFLTKDLHDMSYNSTEEVKKYAQAFNTGHNSRVRLAEINDDITGASTFEDGGIMSESYVRRVLGFPESMSIEDIRKHSEFRKQGIKLMNRTSAKMSFTVVSDEDFRRMLDIKEGETTPDLILSKDSFKKRELHNALVEILATQNISKDSEGNWQKETSEGVYEKINGIAIDNESLYDESLTDEQREELLLRQLGYLSSDTNIEYSKDEIKTASELFDQALLDVTEGWMYTSITDDVLDGPDNEGRKSAGDHNTDSGGVISPEDLMMFDGLQRTTYTTATGQIKNIDPTGRIFNYINERTRKSKEEFFEELYQDNYSVAGKEGRLRRKYLDKKMPNSTNQRLIPDARLKHNQVSVPLAALIEMNNLEKNSDGSYKMENGKYVLREKEALFKRDPLMGRRSFLHVEIVINYDEGASAIGMHPALNALPHADHDGDRGMLFALIGADTKTKNAIQKAFGHTYGKDAHNFSDNAFQGENFEIENSTSRNFVFEREHISTLEPKLEQLRKKLENHIKDKQKELEEYEKTKEIDLELEKIKATRNDLQAQIKELEEIKKELLEKHGVESIDDIINKKNKEFIESRKFSKREDHINNFAKAKMLKDYAGLFKGQFDKDYHDYIMNKENRMWFLDLLENNHEGQTEVMKNLREELLDLLQKNKISDFYSYTTFVYDFYSQKTFDYTKHGEESNRISFENVYRAIGKRNGINFQERIVRQMLITLKDKELTDELKSNPEYTEELYEKDLINYINKINENEVEVKDSLHDFEDDFEMGGSLPKSESEKKNLRIKASEDEIVDSANEALVKNSKMKKEAKDKMSEVLEKAREGTELNEDEVSSLIPKRHISKNAFNVYQHTSVTDGSRKEQIFLHINKLLKGAKETEKLRSGEYTIVQKGKNENFTNIIRDSVLDLIDSLSHTNSFLENNIKLVLRDEDGNELQSFSLGQLITEKNRNTELPVSNLSSRFKYNHSYSLTRKLNINKENIHTMGFEIDDAGLTDPEIIDRANLELSSNLGKEIQEALIDFGYEKIASVNPAVYNKLSFEIRLFDNLFSYVNSGLDKISGKDTQNLGPSTLIKMLTASGDIESLQEIRSLLLPMYTFQTIVKYISGDKISNALTNILKVKGLFSNDQNKLFKFNVNDKSSINNFISQYIYGQGYGLSKEQAEIDLQKMPTLLEDAAAKVFKAENLTPENIERFKNEFVQLVMLIDQGLPNVEYGRSENFNNFGTAQEKIDLISKLFILKHLDDVSINGHINLEEFEEINKDYNITSKDLHLISEKNSFESEDLKLLIRTYDNIISRLYNTTGVAGMEEIIQELITEKQSLFAIQTSIKQLNNKLMEVHINQTDVSNIEKDGAFLRSSFHLESSQANIIILKNSPRKKQLNKSSLRIANLIFNYKGRQGTDSLFSLDMREFEKDFTLKNEIYSLYLYDNRNQDDFIKTLEGLLNHQTTKQIQEDQSRPNVIPLTIEYLLLLNQFSKLTNTDKVGLHHLESLYSELKSARDLKILEDGTKISYNNIFKREYNMYFDSLTQEEKNKLLEMESQLVSFLSKNQHISKSYMNESDFIKVFFGKLIFNKEVFNTDLYSKTRTDIYKDRLDLRIKEIEDFKKEKDRVFDYSTENISLHIKTALEINPDQNIPDLINDVLSAYEGKVTPETKESLKNAVNEYLKDKNTIPKVSDTNIIDTYSIANLIDYGIGNIKVKSLSGMYLHLFNEDLLTDEDKANGLVYAPIERAEAIIADKIKAVAPAGFKFAAKTHVALMDIFYTHEVLKKIANDDEVINKLKLVHGEDSQIVNQLLGIRDNDENVLNSLIFMDQENLVNVNNPQPYEISYIYFENGELKFKQHILKVNFDTPTFEFLRRKGFFENIPGTTETYMDFLIEQQRNIKRTNIEILKEIMTDLNGKTVVGHSILGDIDLINNEFDKEISRNLNREIRKFNPYEKEFMDKLDNVDSYENFFKYVDNYKPTKEKEVDALMNVLEEAFITKLRNEFLPKGEYYISRELENVYIAKLDAMRLAFVRGYSEDTLKQTILEFIKFGASGILRDTQPTPEEETLINSIIEKYNLRMQENLNRGTVIKSLPRVKYDNLTGRFFVDQNFFSGEENEFKGTVQFKVLLSKDDGYKDHSFARTIFANEAFYHIIDDLKNFIYEQGVTLEDYTNTVEMEKRLDLESLHTQYADDPVMINLINEAMGFLASGDNKNYILRAHSILGRQEKIHNKTENRNFIGDDFTVTNDYLESVENSIEEPIKKIEMLNDFMKMLDSKFDYLIDDQLNKVFGTRFESNRKESIKVRLESVLSDLAGVDFRFLDLEGFEKIVGLSANEPINKLLYDEFKNAYTSLIRSGIKVTLKGGVEKGVIKPNDYNLHLFKKQAFYSILYNIGEDHKYASVYLYEHLIDDEYLNTTDRFKFNSTPDDAVEGSLQLQLKEKRKRILGKKEEHKTNKENFGKEKVKLQNLLFKEDWVAINNYINNRPKYKNSSEQQVFDDLYGFDALQNRFNEIYNNLIQNGLTLKKRGLTYTDDEISYSEDSEYTISYQGKNTASDRLIKEEVIRQLYKEINAILYVEEYYSTAEKSVIIGKLTAEEYNINIKEYGGSFTESDLMQQSNLKNRSREAYKFMYAEENRVEGIRNVQHNFRDMIDPYYVNGVLDKEALLKDIKSGYLGQNFYLTIASDMTVKELEALRKIQSSKEVGKDKMNVKFDQKEFDELRTTPTYTSDVELLDQTHPELFDQLRDSPLSVIKILDIKTMEQLEAILDMADEFESIGFTLKNEFLKAERESYKDFKPPKIVSFINDTVVRFQKFITLLNPMFHINNMIQGLSKNYKSVLGTDDPLYQNKRFFEEGKRAMAIDSKYGMTKAIHVETMIDIENAYEELSKLEIKLENGLIQPSDYNDLINNLNATIALNIKSIKDFNKKIKDPDIMSELNILEEILNQLENRLDNLDFSNEQLTYNQFKNILTEYFNTYYNTSYKTRTVLNSTRRNSQMNFETMTDEETELYKSQIYLMEIIYDMDNEGVIYDKFELSGADKAVNIYNAIKGKTEDAYRKNAIANGIGWLINSAPILKNHTNLMNKISRHQRIHGVFLDMFHNKKSQHEAMAQSLNKFFNYGMKTDYENSMVLLFPYTSYMIRNLDYQINMLNNPEYIRFISRVYAGLQTLYKSDDDDPRDSDFYNIMAANNGWLPIGKNYGIKTSNSMFKAINIMQDPFGSLARTKNPLLQQIENLATNNEFDPNRLATGGRIQDWTKSVQNVITGNFSNPADILPSVFYDRNKFQGKYNKYTPYRYRINYDYRNLNRELFFPDGTRRKPSRNPYTTARNTLYKARVNASINRRLKSGS